MAGQTQEARRTWDVRYKTATSVGCAVMNRERGCATFRNRLGVCCINREPVYFPIFGGRWPLPETIVPVQFLLLDALLLQLGADSFGFMVLLDIPLLVVCPSWFSRSLSCRRLPFDQILDLKLLGLLEQGFIIGALPWPMRR